MSNPRIKRAFAGAASDPAQRQITSFFGLDADDGKTSSHHSPHTHTDIHSRGASPSLPPSVQASLLAVGMRVRKSVPEGYKTGKEDGKLLQPSRPQPQPQQQLRRPSQVSMSMPTYADRELLPFCAINQVGGLAVQSFPRDSYSDTCDDEPPSLTSSQETVSSSSSWDDDQQSTRKRRQDDDDDDDEDGSGYRPIDVSAMPPPSVFYQRGRRVLAVPRRRQAHTPPQQQQQFQLQSAAPQKTGFWQDQENGASGIMMGGDFDEADFLDANAWAEQDQEMGGV